MLLRSTIHLLFPILCSEKQTDLDTALRKIEILLKSILLSIQFNEEDAETKTQQFIDAFETIYILLLKDAESIYQNDPAAESIEEVIVAYPGFLATLIHRIAHELYQLNTPILPRLFSEYAHRETGIDIHPGASIGKAFCIDHGTGVVIGETAIIGNNVKIYQGVTLGAKSVSKAKAGSKRHPTIENNVVIYSGTTILGGDTTIGHHAIVGGNVWLTKSIDPHTVVLNTSDIYIKNKNTKYRKAIDFVI